jgi:hypothetical protein
MIIRTYRSFANPFFILFLTRLTFAFSISVELSAITSFSACFESIDNFRTSLGKEATGTPDTLKFPVEAEFVKAWSLSLITGEDGKNIVRLAIIMSENDCFLSNKYAS